MSAARTWLVGGLSSLHDPLLAAALRGAGMPAVAMHPPTDGGLRCARALGNHGQCNPAHYTVGAVLEHVRRSGQEPEHFADHHGWLTAGSCGPCRLASFGLEYARVLRGAGLGRLPVSRIEPLAFLEGQSALLHAVLLGDVLTLLGHTLRPYAVDPEDVDGLLASATGELAHALERRASLIAPLQRIGVEARSLPRDASRVLPRVLIVGEPWTTLADGDPSYDLARRLGAQGARVDAPLACDWLHYRIWEEGDDVRARRAERRIRVLWRCLTLAAGLGNAPRPDMNELAELARPHYDPDVRGGSAHLEIGRALMAARDRSADLVISLKPFGCLPSSHISDGILSVLLRRTGGPAFLALETSGDADSTVESRLEMALHTASAEAARPGLQAT
jgi:predicted nucleotide-binding protein (sugar kinase/HSP70/actin superfamily)